MMKETFAEYVKRNASALATTHKIAIEQLPSGYWHIVYINIPRGVSEDYEPERQEMTIWGHSKEDAEKRFFERYPGLHQNGYLWGSEIEHTESYTVAQAYESGWDL